MMLFYFTPDEVGPYLPAIDRRFNAPFHGPLGENPECMTRYFLSFVLAAMNDRGVPALLRGLDHKEEFISKEALSRLGDMLSIPVGKRFMENAGNDGPKVPLFPPHTAADEARLDATLYPELPRFVAMLTSGGMGRGTGSIIAALAQPRDVSPHLIDVLDRQPKSYDKNPCAAALEKLRPQVQSANLPPEKLLEAAYSSAGEKRHQLFHELAIVDAPMRQKLVPPMLEIVHTDHSAGMLPIAYLVNTWSPLSLDKDPALIALLPQLAKALRVSSPDVALCLEPLPSYAAVALIEAAGPDAAKPFVKEIGEALNAQPVSPSEQEHQARRKLADMLLSFGNEGLSALARAFAHPDPAVRAGAINALNRIIDLEGKHLFDHPRWFAQSRLPTREEAQAFVAQNAHALATVIHDKQPGDQLIDAVMMLGKSCSREDLPESDLKRLKEIGESGHQEVVYVGESAKAYLAITGRTRSNKEK
jgi:hypothetical protein